MIEYISSGRTYVQRSTSSETTRSKRTLWPNSTQILGSFLLLLCLATAAFSQTNGVMLLQNMTTPRGGVWITDTSAAGGHWWQTDGVLGLCRVDALLGANPPWQLNQCNATAKTSGQAVVGPAPATIGGKATPAGTLYIYVPDASSKSVNVVRFQYNPNQTLSSPLTMQVPNVHAVGGGTGGGRPVAIALDPNGKDLYVGYLKSGDIMKISNAQGATSSTPVVSLIGSTSDGRGVNAFTLFNGDLYLAESGGNGLSKIPDISGKTRPPCAASAPCTAQTLFPQVTFFPGGLVSDSTFIYIGEAPNTGTPGDILRYNPATGAVNIYSVNVPPYTSNFDGVTRNAYASPIGLGLAPNGDLYVGDDPTFTLIAAVLPTLQGHVWRVPAAPVPLTITSVAPNSGSSTVATAVTVTGTGFSAVAGASSFSFGNSPATNVVCASTTSCTMMSPTGLGTVDITAFVGGASSSPSAADQFTYVAPPPPATGPVVTAIAPTSGLPGGGTRVTISGSNLAGASAINFGANLATSVSCSADGTTCTALSPAGIGSVPVLVTVGTSTSTPGPLFNYTAPSATLWGWGITAPKGGVVWVPGSLGGHFWSSDHSAGFCRQDPVSGTTLHAINYAVCDNGTIGSPGQAVYDPRLNADGVTHYIYVPDNAVKSTAVWRLTFDPTTETITGAPEAMVPLADVRTLKPNGMALGPDGNLYITDLTEANIRQLTGPNGDPRLQTIGIVAQTGDLRGANGTIGFVGSHNFNTGIGDADQNILVISENRAAAYFDITKCPANAPVPCATTPIPLPSGVFVAGVATDQVNHIVYAADSPGGANATVWRYNFDAPGATSQIYLQGGVLPAAGSPNATVYCALTCTRPWDPALTPGGTGPFSFAFGLYVDPTNGDLYVTGDATAGARGGRGEIYRAPLVP